MRLEGVLLLLRGTAARLHLVAAILPLLFFAAFLVKAVRHGFSPTAEAYPRYEFSLDRNWRQIQDFFHGEQKKAEGDLVVCIWGLAGEPGGRVSAAAPAVDLAERLARMGVRVRATNPGDLEVARFLAGRSAEIVADPWAALAGSDVLVLGCPWPDYVTAPDFARIAATMRGRSLLDLWGRWNGGEVEKASLDYLRAGTDSWPMWLDPELTVFEQGVRQALAAAGVRPRDATILLVPYLPVSSLSPRGRWYLPLNYRLFPARLLLPRPDLACGTIPQYWEWVRRILEDGPGEGPYWPPEYLDEILRRTGAGWLLFFQQNDDFRVSDWRLLRVEKAGGAGQ